MTRAQTGGWAAVHIRSADTVRCEPDWNWTPSSLAFRDFDLWYVWAGRGWMEFSDGRRVEVGPGSTACLRPGQPPRRAEHDRADRLGVCYVHFDFVDRAGHVVRGLAPEKLPPVLTRLDDGRTTGFHEMTLRRVVELVHLGSPAARHEAGCYLQGLVLGLYAGHPAKSKPYPASPLAPDSPAWADACRRLEEVVRHLREDPAETFRVEALAARAHYSTDHFARLFAAVYGQTPKAFCIRLRLERARLLLTESDLTVDQIARNLGYRDVFFFSRQFKERVGLPPSVWRAATRGGIGPPG